MDRGFVFDDLRSGLSAERLERFLNWADGDPNRALDLYALNCQLAESLYPVLHFLEIALRNRISNEAARIASEEAGLNWFDLPQFQRVENQLRQIDKAKHDLAQAKIELSAGKLIASLTFSYWTSFLNRAYESEWRKGLHRIACGADGRSVSRKDLSEPIDRLRRLRNRIAHHEPILAWDLRKHHANGMNILRLLSPPAAALCRSFDRFPSVYPPGGVGLAQKKTPAGEESAGAS